MNLNADLVGENLTQINGGKMINVDLRVKNVMYVKKNKFRILLYVTAKNGKYITSAMDNSAITCDEIIESFDKETYFSEKEQPEKRKTPIFYLHFC